MSNVSSIANLASGFAAYSGQSAAPVSSASFSKLKISEMDGKDAASIFSSSPDEGKTLKKVLINSTPEQKINDNKKAQAVDQTRQALVQTNPTPDVAPSINAGGVSAAVQAYQAIGGFSGGQSGGQAAGAFSFAG